VAAIRHSRQVPRGGNGLNEWPGYFSRASFVIYSVLAASSVAPSPDASLSAPAGA